MGYLGLSTSLSLKAALLSMKYVYTQTHVASKWPGSKLPVRSLLPQLLTSLYAQSLGHAHNFPGFHFLSSFVPVDFLDMDPQIKTSSSVPLPLSLSLWSIRFLFPYSIETIFFKCPHYPNSVRGDLAGWCFMGISNHVKQLTKTEGLLWSVASKLSVFAQWLHCSQAMIKATNHSAWGGVNLLI